MRLVLFETVTPGGYKSKVYINPDMVVSLEEYSGTRKDQTYLFTPMKMYLVLGNLPFVIERLGNATVQDT